VWPEVDTYVRVNDHARLFFVASTVQEERATTEGEFGANLDLHFKPIRREPALLFRLDEAKNRVLAVRIGYRYLASYTGDAPENRGVLEVTTRYPLTALFGDLLVSDRNRMDFRFMDGAYSWRYRNRLSMEKELSRGAVRVNPYARFEAYYDSRYEKWSRTESMLGASFPVTRRWELEGYFDAQHDTGGSPNRTTKAIGAATTLYF